MSAKARLLEHFRDHVGEVLDGEDLVRVGAITAWARRIRELRAEGWRIVTHHDDASLHPGQYMLTSATPENIMKAFLNTPPRKRQDWRFVRERERKYNG